MKKIKTIICSVAILAVLFFIILIASIFINSIQVPSIDSKKIMHIEKELRELFVDYSPEKVDEMQQKNKNTIFEDVIFLKSQTEHDEILVIAYWNNKYKGRDFFVVLRKNGDIAVANTKTKR